MKVVPTQEVLSPEDELDKLSFILFCTEDKRERSRVKRKMKVLQEEVIMLSKNS